MLKTPDEQLYELMQENEQLRKALFKCWCSGEKVIANELINSLGIPTDIDRLMNYISTL